MFRYLLISFIIFFNLNYSQDYYKIDLTLEPLKKNLIVKQNIKFLNNYDVSISELTLLDWNSSFSNFNSPLSKQLYSEFDSSLLKPNKSPNAPTLIKSLKINKKTTDFRRAKDQVDVIVLENIGLIKPGEIINIQIDYVINFPDYKILDYGNDRNEKFVINDYFITVPPYFNNRFSNKGFNDKLNRLNTFEITINNLKDYEIISNADKYVKTNKTSYLFNNKRNIKFIISKKSLFKEFNFNDLKIFSENHDIINLKDSIFNRINLFINESFDKPLKKYVFTNKAIVENKLYPYSEIPDFIKIFDSNFLDEINLVKLLIKENLKNRLSDLRTNYWLYSGLEIYFLNEYIDMFYADKKLIGNYSRLPFFKNHNFSNYSFNDQFFLINKFVFSRDLNQKISSQPENLTRINYRLNNPYSSFNNLKYLENFIGRKSFKLSINDLFNNSNKKISQIFQKNSEQDLEWFFNDLLNEDENLEFKIIKKNNNYSVTSNNKNNYPVILRTTFSNNKSQNEYISFTNKYDLRIDQNNISKIEINPPGNLIEKNYKDNIIYIKSKKPKSIFRFLTDFEKEYENQIYYRPLFSYNLYNGFSTGITLTNKSPLRKTFTYFFNPQYSFKTKKPIGSINLGLRNVISKTNIVNYNLNLSNFNYNYDLYYTRFSPTLSYIIKNKNLKSNKRLFFQLKNISINKQLEFNEKEKYSITSLSILKSNINADKSKSLLFNSQLGNSFLKTSLTYSFRKYYKAFRQYNFRLFIGKFIQNNSINNTYDFSTSSISDYTYSSNLLGRSENEGFFSQQYFKNDVGFKSKINPSFSNDYVASLNSGITIWKWFEGYFDYGIFKNKGEKLKTGYDTGLKLNIIENYLELYFPILNSDKYILNSNNYLKNIRFTLELDTENLTNLFTRRWF
ncbi:MAG: hypothetical protein VX042_02880 [Bacteroidota bacterium]|nr:hypothetical protein [Bacteroidota bacterium]